MRWDSIFAVVPVCVSSFGIILTVVTFAIFYRNRDTPLVRASGRELSYVILSGLLVCYLNTYILLAKPGTIVCLLQRSVDVRIGRTLESTGESSNVLKLSNKK